MIIRASKFGRSEIMIMRKLAKRMAIDSVIRKNASNRLSRRFSMRNLFPLINIFVDPVIVAVTESRSVETKIDFIRGSITCTSESNLVDPMSAILVLMRILLKVESTNDFANPLLSF